MGPRAGAGLLDQMARAAGPPRIAPRLGLGDPVSVARWSHTDLAFTVEPADEITVVVNLSATHRTERRSHGRTEAPSAILGGVTVLPAGSEGHYRIQGEARVLQVRVAGSLAARWLEEEGRSPHAAPAPLFHAREPEAERLAYRLALTAGHGSDDGFGEALAARALVLHLHGARSAERVRTGGLSPAALRRALDCLRDGTRTGVEELARDAGLSPSHFAREFRRSTGLPPHRWLVRHRMERAVALLGRPGLSVARIAFETGFCHAGHLARHFRREFGCSPAAFREHVLP